MKRSMTGAEKHWQEDIITSFLFVSSVHSRFKKEWICCLVINKTRNTYFLFLITAPFFQTLFFTVSGTGHMSTVDEKCNCFPHAVHQSIFQSTAGPVPQFLVPIPCMKSHVLSYHLQEGNCNTKEGSIWFPFVHPCLYKKIPSLASHPLSLTISGQQEWNCIYSVLVLATSSNPHVHLSATHKIIKAALKPKVTV